MPLEVKYLPIEDLKPYERNARVHDKASIKAIKRSIEAFGFNDPIGLWNGVIVEGHGRYIAARELGYATVPVVLLDDLTDDERKAYALAHNRTAELSEWDYDVVAEELKQLEVYVEFTGFEEETTIDWDAVPLLEDGAYDEPQHQMLTCPCCGHVDRRIHFKKIIKEG